MQSVRIEPPAADGFENGVAPRSGVVNAALPHFDQAICKESATRARLRNFKSILRAVRRIMRGMLVGKTAGGGLNVRQVQALPDILSLRRPRGDKQNATQAPGKECTVSGLGRRRTR